MKYIPKSVEIKKDMDAISEKSPVMDFEQERRTIAMLQVAHGISKQSAITWFDNYVILGKITRKVEG